jgi:hypothetical protein
MHLQVLTQIAMHCCLCSGTAMKPKNTPTAFFRNQKRRKLRLSFRKMHSLEKQFTLFAKLPTPVTALTRYQWVIGSTISAVKVSYNRHIITIEIVNLIKNSKKI